VLTVEQAKIALRAKNLIAAARRTTGVSLLAHHSALSLRMTPSSYCLSLNSEPSWT